MDETERWTFGEPALPQTRRLAAAVRRVSSLALALETPSPVVDRLTDALEGAGTELEALVPPDARPRVGDAAPTDGRVYLDHSRHVGRFNPAFPEYDIVVDGDRAHGTVAFPELYEGPPGVVHGGFLALFFDCVIQHHNCDVGVTGKTTGIELGYRAPTPLRSELSFELARSVDGKWITSTGELRAGEQVCVTATMRAVAGDRAALPEVSGRRR